MGQKHSIADYNLKIMTVLVHVFYHAVQYSWKAMKDLSGVIADGAF